MGKFDNALEIMRQIRTLPIQEKYVRMIVDYGDASMTTAMSRYTEGVSKLDNILEVYRDLLQTTDFRYLYEEIQERRGFALTTLERDVEAVSVLEEAATFVNSSAGDMQSVYFYLGISYAATLKVDLAKVAYLRAIEFHLSNSTEADAHYRVAVLYFRERAFAQAKNHLEAALEMPDAAISKQLRGFIYQQMSRTCHYLGEVAEEQKYSRLAQAS